MRIKEEVETKSHNETRTRIIEESVSQSERRTKIFIGFTGVTYPVRIKSDEDKVQG